MDNIITSIHTHFDIKSEPLEILLSNLNLLHVPKKTKLIQPERSDKNIYFVEKGIARAYTIRDGKKRSLPGSAKRAIFFIQQIVFMDPYQVMRLKQYRCLKIRSCIIWQLISWKYFAVTILILPTGCGMYIREPFWRWNVA